MSVPLQRWMTEHGHPGWYSWLVVIGGALSSSVLAVAISVTLADRSLDRERAQREQARQATCTVVQTMADVYNETPPVTETGKSAADAWNALGVIFGCKGK